MMPQRGASPQGFSLRNARIIWSCFVVAACWFMLIAHFMRHVSPTAPAPAFKWVLLAVGAVDIVVIGAIRRNFLEQSRDKAARGETVAARAAWSVAQMMGFASAMSIVLFGFVLSMMVAGWFSTIFYGAGLLLLVGYRPQPAE